VVVVVVGPGEGEEGDEEEPGEGGVAEEGGGEEGGEEEEGGDLAIVGEGKAHGREEGG